MFGLFCLFILYISSTPLTWLAILPLNYLEKLRSIQVGILLFRFVEHFICIVIVFSMVNYHDYHFFEYYTLIAFILTFSMLAFFMFDRCNEIVLDEYILAHGAISTNRTLSEMMKLKLFNEINQMHTFGYVYPRNEWIRYVDTTNGDTLVEIFIISMDEGYDWIVSKLIEFGGSRALIQVLSDGRTDTALKLIDMGANVNEKDNKGNTALMVASENGLADIVSKLIESGANVQEKDDDGKTALMRAFENGKTDAATKLFEIGPKINEKDNDGKTLLMYASECSHTDAVSKLIELGVNVHEQDKYGNTALGWASRSRNLRHKDDTVSKLMASGLNVLRPLNIAHADTASKLIEFGAK